MGGLGDEAPADEIFETLLRHRPHSISRRLLHSMQRRSATPQGLALALREKRQEVRNRDTQCMASANAGFVDRLVEAWNRSDVDAILALFDPECEVVFPPEVPEPGPFHGHAELRQWAEGFLAAWEFHHSEVVEIVDAGDSVVAMLHLVGRGIGSGVEMDETDAHVFTIGAGRVVRWQNFNERADALAAVGLQE